MKPKAASSQSFRRETAFVQCLDDVDARFRAVRTFVELLGWCSEMPGHVPVDAHTVGATSYLMMREVEKLEEALERLKEAIE